MIFSWYIAANLCDLLKQNIRETMIYKDFYMHQQQGEHYGKYRLLRFPLFYIIYIMRIYYSKTRN